MSGTDCSKYKAELTSGAVATASAATGACCGKKVRDVVENMDKICGSLDFGGIGAEALIQNGKVAFRNFPNVQKCDRGISGKYTLHREISALCSGFDGTMAVGTNRLRFDPVADQAGQCWKWQCKSGYTAGNKGKCLTPAEKCAETGQVLKNGICVPDWCRGWETGYDSKTMFEMNVGNCNEFRCNAGTFFAAPNDRSKCATCAPAAGTVGGCVANAGGGGSYNPGGDYWHVKTCNDDEYVDLVGSVYKCKPMLTASDQRIKDCWKCPTVADIRKCVAANVNPPECQ
jgi:hypothetical protein